MQSENCKTSSKRSIDETEENEPTMTITEFYEEQKELESRVTAVLGASDETNCSYDKGYVYRQALYCCITCLKEKQTSSPDNLDSLHGICLACSYDCHANHELYELYTKRYFRCDCGNSKFDVNGKIQPCKFRTGKEDKDPVNSLNKYNHNFTGLYCTCNTLYPDEGNTANNSAENVSPSKATSSNVANNSDENSEEMIQCTICEDWFHSNHLEGFGDLNNYDSENCELVCHLCMSKNEFLFDYQGYMVKKVSESRELDQNNSGESNLDVLNNSEKKEEQNENNLNSDAESTSCLLERQKLLNKNLKINEKIVVGTCLFIEGWRDALCKCTKCLDLYKQKDVEFLIKPNDTIKFYEECGKIQDAKKKDEENQFINDEFSKLNRVGQIELIHNVNDLKDELRDFLESFAQSGKVIQSTDVTNFFEDLRERKKRKLEEQNANSAYYCK